MMSKFSNLPNQRSIQSLKPLNELLIQNDSIQVYPGYLEDQIEEQKTKLPSTQSLTFKKCEPLDSINAKHVQALEIGGNWLLVDERERKKIFK